MLAYVVIVIPLAAGLVAFALPWSRPVGWFAAGADTAVLVCGVVLSMRTAGGRVIVALDGSVRIDALSAFMVVVIGAISLLAASQSVRYVEVEIDRGLASRRHAARYVALIQLFVTCMLAAVIAASLGATWIAIEATTIATSFLVGHRRTDRALEASWKYVLICSVGIALAFFGTVLVYFAALHVHGAPIDPASALDWRTLVSAAPRLNTGVMRLAIALIVLGYGTKVGLAPMHSWLPDAHSEAPAPVSALMSGVLLTVAFYAILRFKTISDGALGVGFARSMLVIVGLGSLVIAASLLLTQHDYKRMLAYSSVEHMGLIALGAAAGSALAIVAVLLHILGHGLTKSVLFLASGEILIVEGSTEIADVPALLARRPVLGGIFGFGLVALLGLPPFSLFVSELNMARSEFAAGLGWAAAIALCCMAVIFAALIGHGRRLLLGDARPGAAGGSTSGLVSAPLIGGLGVCAAFGVAAWPLQSLLHAAASVVAR
jgi:hydrogenase-4 component F